MNFISKDFSWTDWFQRRGLQVLDYQIDILENKLPNSLAENKKPTVLAACPSAGKTLISIAFLEAYLKANPGHRVLVLTHGTTVLRSQYHGVLKENKPDFSFTDVTSGKEIKTTDAQVVITLPQTLHRVRNLPHFDLLVVDEAHQFYFAPMVKSIIKRARPLHQLLLTGTPSPFIYRNYPIIPITVSSLLEYEMVEDLFVELASSTYNFKNEDYNQHFDLKDEVEFRVADTWTTLDQLLEKVEERLTSLVKYYPKTYSGLQNTIGWAAPLRSLRKTMFACKSQGQAKQVAEYFTEKGVDVALSTSDTDTGSEEIERFRGDSECLVLIVVGRGVLGFNFPELENVIDMTCSHNIDRIFQLLCRVIRKHPQDKKKLYFKVVPHHLEEYFRHVMTCVLCLTDEQYYTIYDGKNFLRLKIPVVKSQKREPRKGTTRKPGTRTEEIKPIELAGLPAISLMQSILHKTDGPLNPYAYTTMQEVRNNLLLTRRKNYWTLELCREDAAQCSTRDEWRKRFLPSYFAAKRGGWFEECCSHMPPSSQRGPWTFEECKVDAAQYSTLGEWAKNSSSAYNAARRKDWLEKCSVHMVKFRKPKNYWASSKETCRKEALQYSTLQEWRKKSGGSYDAACRNGWFEELSAHVPKNTMPGTSLDKRSQKWSAYINHDKRRYSLGSHDTQEEAYAAYVKAKKRIAKGLSPKE